MINTTSLRWRMTLLLCTALFVLGINRQAYSIFLSLLMPDLEMTNLHYGMTSTLYWLVFSCVALVSGFIIDRVGSRVSLSVGLVICALANLGAAAAGTDMMWSVSYVLLAVGVPVVTIVAAKVVAEWVPSQKRGTTFGLFSLAGSMSAILSTVILLSLAMRIGWRYATAAAAGMSVLSLIAWLGFYPRQQLPLENSEASKYETASVEPSYPDSPQSFADVYYKPFWQSGLAWALILGAMLTGQITGVLMGWFGTDQSVNAGARLTGLTVVLPSIIGIVGGGVFSDSLIGSGTPLAASRLKVMTWATILMVPLVFLPWISVLWLQGLLGGLAVMGNAAWVTLLKTLTVDLTPYRYVGGIVGITLATGGLIIEFMERILSLMAKGSPAATGAIFVTLVVLQLCAWGLVRKAVRKQTVEEKLNNGVSF